MDKNQVLTTILISIVVAVIVSFLVLNNSEPQSSPPGSLPFFVAENVLTDPMFSRGEYGCRTSDLKCNRLLSFDLRNIGNTTGDAFVKIVISDGKTSTIRTTSTGGGGIPGGQSSEVSTSTGFHDSGSYVVTIYTIPTLVANADLGSQSYVGAFGIDI